MGFSSENWVMAGIPLRGPLKPICTTTAAESDDESTTTTPTSSGSRIPSKLACPPPPKKRRAAPAGNRCNYSTNGKKEFFVIPDDLEAVFMRRHVGVSIQ